jgi:hypothetical protein
LIWCYWRNEHATRSSLRLHARYASGPRRVRWWVCQGEHVGNDRDFHDCCEQRRRRGFELGVHGVSEAARRHAAGWVRRRTWRSWRQRAGRGLPASRGLGWSRRIPRRWRCGWCGRVVRAAERHWCVQFEVARRRIWWWPRVRGRRQRIPTQGVHVVSER